MYGGEQSGRSSPSSRIPQPFSNHSGNQPVCNTVAHPRAGIQNRFHTIAEKASIASGFKGLRRVDFTALFRHTLCVVTYSCGVRRSNLDTNHKTVEWILTQLTAARWSLDQTVGGEPDAVRRNIENARRTYDHVLRLLPEVALTVEKDQQVQQEMAELQYRLQAIENGQEHGPKPQ